MMDFNLKSTSKQSFSLDSPRGLCLQLVGGSRIQQAVNVVVKLNIPDLLVDKEMSAEELAEATGVHPDSLYRLLRALAGTGVFTESLTRKFSLTPVSQYLRTDHPQSLKDLVLLQSSGYYWPIILNLYQSVQSGIPAINYTYQADGYWQYFENHPEEEALFNKAMTSLSRNFHIPAIEQYDFSGVSKMVDIGGGYGELTGFILKANPHLESVLFDLSETIALAAENLKEQGVLNRCQLISGNMFESVPSGGDLYFLSYILTDWNLESCVQILQNIRRAMSPTGKIVILEPIVAPGSEPSWTKYIDLIVMMSGPGKVRTESEFREIYEQASLDLVKIYSTSETFDSLMELVAI